MMKQRKWNTLQDRRCVNNLCQMHKVSHNKFNISFDHILSPIPQCTCSNHQAYVNNFQPTCDAMQNAFFPWTLPSWNQLPPALIDTNDTKAFCKEVTAHLQLPCVNSISHPLNATAQGVPHWSWSCMAHNQLKCCFCETDSQFNVYTYTIFHPQQMTPPHRKKLSCAIYCRYLLQTSTVAFTHHLHHLTNQIPPAQYYYWQNMPSLQH